VSGRPAARRRLTILVGILLLVMVAPWFARRSPELQEDAAGARYLPPLTRAHALRLDAFHLRIVTHLRKTADGWEFERAGKTASIPAAALPGPPQGRFYLLGTDGLGRDLLSRVLSGARHSLGIAALSVVLAMLFGTAAGAAAASSAVSGTR